MTGTLNSSLLRRLGAAFTLVFVVMLAVLAASPYASQAAPLGQAPGDATKVTTIPAGGTATLLVRGFCLQFGKPFPTGATVPTGTADAPVRNALAYAIEKGYTEGNAAQVQLAMWYLSDNQWREDDRTVAQEIADQAGTAAQPTSEGISLVDALAQGSVAITATFTPQTPEAFYGDGQAEVRNLTGAELRVHMPVGVVFTVPNSGGAFQDLVAYELGTERVAVQNTTVAGTPTPQPTQQATAEPSITAVLTPSGTGTVPAAQTTEPAAPVSAATQQPTRVPVVQATPTPLAAAPLPPTGAGDVATAGILLLVMGLALAGLGLMIRFSPNSGR